MADDATVLSTGSEGWVADAEREQRGPLAPKPPTCQSCNQFAPYRLTPQGQKHLRQLEDSGFLELCSLCIKRDPGGQRLFEHGSLFGDTAPAPPKPAARGSRAAAAGGGAPDASSALPTTLQRMLLEESWRADDSHTLMIAAGRGSATEVKRLLQRQGSGLFDVDIEFRDQNGGNTALLCAAGKGHAEVVEVLLTAGARVD